MYTDKKRRIPRVAWVVGGILGILLVIYAGFNIFNYRVVNDMNTLTDNMPNEVLTNDVMADKTEVLAWYKETIETLEERVDNIEKMAIESGDNMRDTYQEHLLALEEELDTLRNQLKQVRTTNGAEWEAMKDRVRETRARVETKLENDYKDYSVDASDTNNP